MDLQFVLLVTGITVLLFFGLLGVVFKLLPGSYAERIAISGCCMFALAVLEVYALGLFWNHYTKIWILALELILLLLLYGFLWEDIKNAVRDLSNLFLLEIINRRSALVLVTWLCVLPIWAITLLYTFKSPVPGVDAVSYHLPIAVYIKQEKGLERFETRSGHVNEFPKNAQMTFARVITLLEDERPVRLVQWLSGFIAVFAIYGWMRNWGCSRELSGSLAALFLLMPAVLAQPMVLWGTIDLVFHTFLICAYTLMSRVPQDSSLAVRRGIWVAAISGLAIGSKGQGLVLGGMALFLYTLFLVFEDAKRPVLHWFRFFLFGGAFLLLFGSYTYIQNYLWFGNPFQPITLKFGETVLFEGAYDHIRDLVGTKEHTGTRNNRKALFRSMEIVWANDWVYKDMRMGGWGPVWLFFLFPGLVVTMFWAFLKGRWKVAFTGVIFAFLLFNLEGSWWSRFTLYIFGMGLVYLALFLEWLPKLWVRKLLSWALLVLALFAASESLIAYWKHNIPEGLEAEPGHYLHSLDTYRVRYFWEDKDDRNAYLFARNNLPSEATLVYFHPYWAGIYPYYFYRHDYNNRTYAFADAETPEEFERILEEYGATHFMTQFYLKMDGWADQYGTKIYEEGKFAIWRYTGKEK